MDKSGAPMERTESPGTPLPGWFKLSFSGSVARRALSTALIVGFVLNAINHGEAVMRGTVTGAQWIQMVLTCCVPYCVSTYSSVRAILEMKRQPAGETTARASGDSHDHT
jgi:hypothetical protein